MSEIVLTRIDDRLIHGQVMTAWVKKTKGNHIIIIDDEVANDDFMREILLASIPDGIKLSVWTVNEAIESLTTNSFDGDKIIILVKNPVTLMRLIDSGIQITNINVGGMGANSQRKVLYRNISVSSEERDIFRQLLSKGVDINIRIIPDQKQIPLAKLL